MSAGYRQTLFQTLLALVVIGIAAFVTYYPGLHGPFVFDDHINFVDKPEIAIQSLEYKALAEAAMSNESGILKRPLAALSFALNYYFASGFADTFAFKATNLGIHIINASLVFWLFSLLLQTSSGKPEFRHASLRPWLPGLIAVVWALHPIQLTTVLSVVQRMTSLSAFFILLGLLIFVHGRHLAQKHDSRGITFMWAGILGGTILGLTCKENAALLPAYALIIELVFFNNIRNTVSGRKRLIWVYATPLILLVLLALFWLIKHPDVVLGSYKLREFTPIERLLTQGRVLWFYLSLLLLPGINRLTLFHDDIPVSTSLVLPWTTSLALVGIIVSVLVAITSRRKYPWLSFSILWFLVGHSMESSFIGLELAHEHRNYLPGLGPVAGAIYVLVLGFGRFKDKILPVALLLLIVASLAFSTHVIARNWADEISLAEFMVRHHPSSARSHGMLGDVYLKKGSDPIQSLIYYKKASELAPYETSYLIRMVLIASAAEVQWARVSKPWRRSIPGDLASITLNEHGGEMRLQLDRSIFGRITEQLRLQPVHDRVEGALKILTNCILEQPQYCGYLYKDTVSWYRLALDNPRGNISVRKRLSTQLVRLYLERGNLRQALRVAEEARSLDPLQPALAIMEANIHVLADRPDKANGIIRSLMESGITLSKTDQEEAEKILVIIKQQH
ncbi:MAG: hypothetical protein WD823_07795 [Sulfuricaulis sp.]|uniref:tetratricopeptide repeat protein n=1 Tax=Sulfuricaulis sp. TaxID=2003553 RepID=UPI0034A1C120